jgi:formyl-CoA transferase
VFPTADGYINIAVAGQEIYERFCRAIGAPHLMTDDRFKTGALRSKNRSAMNAAIGAITSKQGREHWISMLNEAGCPCGPIYSMDQVFGDPQVKHVAMTAEVDHPALGKFRVVNQAIKLSRTPSSVRSAASEAGADTDQVLEGLGYAKAAIEDFRRRRVI